MEKLQTLLESATGLGHIHVCYWVPEGEPKGIVQLVHGMAEHIARYDDFACFLAGHGYLVVGHDHAGHGNSMFGKPNEGYFADSDGWSCLVRDIHSVYLDASDRYPDRPYIMFGHSMGSMLVRTYMSRRGEDMDGFIVCGTCGKNPVIGVAKLIAKQQIKKHGPKAKGTLLNKLAFGSYCKKWPDEKSEFCWLSAKKENVKHYEEDPWCGFLFTNKAFEDLFNGIAEISSKTWAQDVAYRPILMIAGADDPVGDYGKGVKQVYDELLKTNHNVRLKLYDGMRHEILNEDDNTTVYSDVLEFVDFIASKYEV
ncbi:MAG: alpha/beta hydrolase [Clostridiales bacterium]|nr:alpha/beta hydrolase [Clostridiales bacterium]